MLGVFKKSFSASLCLLMVISALFIVSAILPAGRGLVQKADASTPPVVTITSPAVGTLLNAGTAYNFTSTAAPSSSLPNVVLTFTNASGQTMKTTSASIIAANSSFNWTIPSSWTSGTYTLSATSNGTAVTIVNNKFAVLGQPVPLPVVTITFPSSGAILNAGTGYTFTSSAASPLDNVVLTFINGSGQTVKTANASVIAANSSFNWTIPSSWTSGTYTLSATSNGQPVTILNHSFTVDGLVTSATFPGWAWSSNIGWVSFISVALDPTTGYLSGDAWSSSVGWISFDNAANTASGLCQGASSASACQPAIVLSGGQATGQVTGWARALTPTQGANVGDSGDWDGWIQLSGTNHTSPNTAGTGGVTYISSGGNDFLLGFAWGGPVVGWLNFYPANPNTNGCSGSGCTGPGSGPGGSGGPPSCFPSARCPGGPNPGDSLSVSISGSGTVASDSIHPGISCVGPGDSGSCSASYAQGTQLTLTASAGPGYVFGSWGGACSGTASTCLVTMNSSQSVTATFTSSAPVVTCGPTETLVQINHVVNWGITSGGSFTTYSWTFSGGISADPTSATPSVTYADPGTYTAYVSVNGGLPQQCQTSVTVSKNPVYIEF